MLRGIPRLRWLRHSRCAGAINDGSVAQRWNWTVPLRMARAFRREYVSGAALMAPDFRDGDSSSRGGTQEKFGDVRQTFGDVREDLL